MLELIQSCSKDIRHLNLDSIMPLLINWWPKWTLWLGQGLNAQARLNAQAVARTGPECQLPWSSDQLKYDNYVTSTVDLGKHNYALYTSIAIAES